MASDLLAYLTRRTGLGRTGWIAIAVIYMAVVGYLVYSFTSYPERGWWVPSAFAVVITAIVVGGTLKNFRTDQALAHAPPVNNHYPEVCEGCYPPRMKDMSPITDPVIWYAATRGHDQPTAQRILANVSPARYAELMAEHKAYLASLK